MAIDMLEQIIQLVTILFLLSMVCERVADFLKHYLNNSQRLGIGDTITKFPGDDIKEQARAYRILKINVWCGIITAAVLKADLIRIFNNIQEPGTTLGWDKISAYWGEHKYLVCSPDFWFLFPGIVLTGCFISFGSKFWHDLLDLLYQIKNAKRVLSDSETYKIDNVDTLSKRLNTYQSEYIQEAYLQAKRELFANPNVKAVSLQYNTQGYYYFEVTLKAPDASIPSFYKFSPREGGPVTIPITTTILGNDDIIPHTINLGYKIANSKTIANFGTLGCIVAKKSDTKNQHYILTCYHNVVDPDSGFSFKKDTINIVLPDKPTESIGEIEYGVRDHEIDAALIRIDPKQLGNIVNDLPGGLGSPKQERRLTNGDVKNGVFALMYGAASGSQFGTVSSVYTDVKIKYEDGEHELLNLIAISRNGKAISQPGDSGGCVIDENNNMLGLLVAGNKTTSYVIPASVLLTKLNLRLI